MNNETATPPTTAIVAADGMTALQVCQNTDNIKKLGSIYAMSGFFGAVTESTATAALINCFVEGLSPVEYRAKYHTMNDGTTTIKSDFIQREFHRLGGKWKFNEWTPEVCDMTFTYQGEELRGRVTIEEFRSNGVAIAKGGGLKDNWRKFPREMLKARCMSTYIRAICPEALGGLYTQEEAQDFTPVAPPKPPAPAPAPQPAAKPETVEAEVVDFAVCPLGRSKGKRFDELPNDTLEKLLNVDEKKYPALTTKHREVISSILAERENYS